MDKKLDFFQPLRRARSWTVVVAALAFLWGSGPSMAQDETFDEENGVWLLDTDLDGFPDSAEELEGTDPGDRDDYPGSPPEAQSAEKVGFPNPACRGGYRPIPPRLCISEVSQDAKKFLAAQVHCRTRRGRVCSYEDLYYLYVKSTLDSTYSPEGRFLGNIVDESTVLCGELAVDTDVGSGFNNFATTCHARSPKRPFWCCHDLE